MESFLPLVDIEDDSYLDDLLEPAAPKMTSVESDDMDHNSYNGYIQAKM